MSIKKLERNQKILKLREQGLGYVKIGKQFNITYQRVMQICNNDNYIEKLTIRAGRWYRSHPWWNNYRAAQQRCENFKHSHYSRYGGRGIKLLMSLEEFKKLWFRDKAYLMQKPSIDRKDNDGNYTYNNCQFIEMIENSTKHRRSARSNNTYPTCAENKVVL